MKASRQHEIIRYIQYIVLLLICIVLVSQKKFLISLKQLILHSKEMLDLSSINGRVDYAFTHT